MNTCATCKWWDILYRVGPCGICNKGEREGALMHPYMNDHGQRPLVTEEAFGCNQWGKKEAQR